MDRRSRHENDLQVYMVTLLILHHEPLETLPRDLSIGAQLTCMTILDRTTSSEEITTAHGIQMTALDL